MPPFADLAVSQAATALSKLHVEDLLVPVLTQLIVIIAVARLAGVVARRLGQPSVIGETVAGLLLGPSLFGAMFGDTFQAVFYPHLPGVDPDLARVTFQKVFEVLKELGLIFLLFLIGLEFEFGHLKGNGRSALAISLVGVVVPFGLGVGLATGIYPILGAATDGVPLNPDGKPIPLLHMALFIGVAMSITAIPVLGRMMLEMGITRTRLGAIVITAAAVEDAIGWILLASVAAIVSAAKAGAAGYDPWQTATMIGLTVGFAAFVFLVLRPVLVWYFRRSMAANGGNLSLTALAVLFVALFGCAIATGLIGIFAIFGAFLLGAALSDQEDLRTAAAARLRDVVTGFFLPIFFTYTGLRTDMGSLGGATLWLVAAAVLATAVLGKLGGCGVTARLCGFSVRESAAVGAMMNTRGLMELIVINVGYNLGVIPQSLFCMLVLMAVLTTMMTTPLLLLLRRGTELEEPMRASGFAK